MNKNIGILFAILIIGLIIRLSLSFLPAFESDQNVFRFWTARLVTLGPANFYSVDVFTNNPLGILYYFWFVGLLKSIFLANVPFSSSIDPILKLAAIFSDLLAGFVIFKIIKEKLNEKLAYIGTAFFVFNPSLIFNSAIWGQYDSVAILFLVLSVYYCLIKKSPIICSIFFSLAWVTKPQSLQLAPFLFIFFLKNFKPIQWIYSLLSFLATAIIIFFPFFPNNPVYGIYYVNLGSTNLFSCTSCNALNFWGIFGNWKNDMHLFLNIPLLYWGFVLLLIILVLTLGFRRLNNNSLFIAISVSMLAFFMLLTRMHERYLSYSLPFILLAAFLLKSRFLTGFYLFFSLVFMLNLYIPYAYYNNYSKITNLPFHNLFSNFSNFSLISFLGFILLFIYYLNYVRKI